MIHIKRIFSGIAIILFAILLALLCFFTRSSNQDKYHIEMSYKEELQHVVVSALRVSPEYEPLDYEFRGPELLSLVDADYIDGVDVLTFDIVEDGMSEIVFYSID